jgi:hypothetical protein
MVPGIGRWRNHLAASGVLCIEKSKGEVEAYHVWADLELVVREIFFLGKEVDKVGFGGRRGILPGLVIFYASKFPGKILQIVPGGIFVGGALFVFILFIEGVISGKPVMKVFVGYVSFHISSLDEVTNGIEEVVYVIGEVVHFTTLDGPPAKDIIVDDDLRGLGPCWGHVFKLPVKCKG